MKKFELGWKVLKELLRYEGVAVASTGSPREILKAAYRFFPCMDENIWLGMLTQRNNMAHMYDGAAAAEFNSTGPDNPKNPEKLLTTDV